ncbi:MAG: hypothetical protein HYV09_06175 [Deltaproteobacteria bacterium]|nr:hypothetical protein [Deltaproteobacteria bacterium]
MSDDNREDPAVIGRRKLMKLGMYAAPIILGTLTISRNAVAASSGFCSPNGTPCSPNGAEPCGPNGSCMPG